MVSLQVGPLSSTIDIFYLFQGDYVIGSVCLFVCSQHYLKSYELIAMKFYGGFWGDFGGDPDHHATIQLGVWPLLNRLRVDFDESYKIALL